MNCKCGYQSCGDDDCDSCEELLCVGLCPSCHIEEECTACKKKLNLEKDNPMRNVMWQYFCNMKCYEKMI